MNAAVAETVFTEITDSFRLGDLPKVEQHRGARNEIHLANST